MTKQEKKRQEITLEECREARDHYEEIVERFEALSRIFRRAGGLTYERFRMYPGGSIASALSDDHDYAGRDTFTIEKLIGDLERKVEPSGQEGEECPECEIGKLDADGNCDECGYEASEDDE